MVGASSSLVLGCYCFQPSSGDPHATQCSMVPYQCEIGLKPLKLVLKPNEYVGFYIKNTIS